MLPRPGNPPWLLPAANWCCAIRIGMPGVLPSCRRLKFRTSLPKHAAISPEILPSGDRADETATTLTEIIQLKAAGGAPICDRAQARDEYVRSGPWP